MGFLDQLKEVGFGARGPYGRMESGAQRLAGTLQNITGPRRMQQMGRTFYELVQSKKKNEPGWQPTEKDVQELAQQAGAKSNEDVAFLLSGLQRAKLQKEQFTLSPGQKRMETSLGGKPVVVAENKLPSEPEDKTALRKNYEFAVQQFKDGVGKDPGSFTQWVIEQKKAGATRISMGEKLGLHEGKKNIDFKVRVKTPAFKKDAIDIAKSKYSSDEWRELDQKEREGTIFETTDELVKEGFADKRIVFGVKNGIQGWFELPETGPAKLIIKWEGFVPRAEGYK